MLPAFGNWELVERQSWGVDSVRVSYACLAHRISVAMFGALPCINRPTLKTLAANQVTAQAAARPTIIVRSTCQVGGGVADPSRIIIANVLTGGMKLRATANAEFGSRPMTVANIHGAMSTSITGVISDCASRISLTAAPTALNTAANSR